MAGGARRPRSVGATTAAGKGRAEPASALREYSAKRAFGVTPEPPPQAATSRTGPLLFVIQQHAARRLHYDFRLECAGVLKSWAVPKVPSLDPADKRLAVRTEDHPFDYASFEGVIPEKQYGAGEVIVWDCGVYSPDEDREYLFHDRAEAERRVLAGLEQGKLSIFLRGAKLKGSFALVRTSGDPKNWLLIKHKDRFVVAGGGTTDAPGRAGSVLSGMTVEALLRIPARDRLDAAQLAPAGPPEAMPARLDPMLAETGDAPFDDPGWLHEPKLDGYRVLAFIDDGKVTLRSRRGGLDLTPVFPGVIAALSQQAVSTMILDGEIVAFGPDGRPSFNALQNRAQLKTPREIEAGERGTPTAYFCFDLLHFAGVNLRGARYDARRRWLEQCLLPSPQVQLVHVDANGPRLYEAALASGFEGIVSKRRDGPYRPGQRTGYWLKVKPTHGAELVVGGYTKGKGSRTALGALLLGYWEGDVLRFAGRVGSGLDEATLGALLKRVEALRTDKCPFAERPPLNGPTKWTAPELVVEVEFADWTETGMLRAPVFLRTRDDIDPRSVKRPVKGRPAAQPKAGAKGNPGREASAGTDGLVAQVLAQLDDKRATFPLVVGDKKFKLTHLDRVYWPADTALKEAAITKRDLLRYLARVSRFMLPHLADRLLTMIRMPEGIAGERFFQKRLREARPDFVPMVTVWSGSKGEAGDYMLCNDLATLLWLGQNGTLEFHVSHSRVKPGPDGTVRSTDFARSEQSLEASVLNYPDYLVFDIDPYVYSGKEAPGDEPELNTAAFEKGKEVAFWLREVLAEMRLEPYVKTSGKTGLHIFVPIERTIDFDTARHMCETVGRHLQRAHPEDITLEWNIPKRTGKIFMDYNMNVRFKTLNVAYSPRGLPGGPVSMPLTWQELAKAHPLDFRISNVINRLEREGDRWQNLPAAKQSLEKALQEPPAKRSGARRKQG